MSPTELLRRIEDLGVRIAADGERLMLDAPKGAIDEDLKQAIRACKPELLELVNSRAHERTTEEFPLSFAQHGFYLQEQLDPANRAYHLWSARKLHGDIDARRLAASLALLVNRHGILRTTFHLGANGPIQKVAAAGEVHGLRFIDLSALEADLCTREVERLTSRSRVPHFDLVAGPPFRLELLRIDSANHVLVLAMHHIAADARSLELFYEELAAAYLGNGNTRSTSSDASDLQYREYARTQRTALESGASEGTVRFWSEQVAGCTELFAALGARPSGSAVETTHWEIDAGAWDAIVACARRHRVTTFTLLLGCYQLLLGRYAHLRDIAVLVPVSTRGAAGLEHVLGPFVSTVLMRTRIDQNSIADFLGAVRGVVGESLAHADIPLEVLEGLLRQRREPLDGLARLSRVAFNYVQQRALSSVADQAVEILDSDRETSLFEMMLIAVDEGGRLRLKLELRQDMFPREFAGGFLRNLSALLKSVAAADPDCPLRNIAFFDAGELHRLLGLKSDASSVETLTDRQRSVLALSGYPERTSVPVFRVDVEPTPATALRHVQELLATVWRTATYLRSRLVRAPFSYGEPVYSIVRGPADDCLRVVCVRGEELEAALSGELGRVASVFADFPCSVVIERGEGGVSRISFLISEILMTGPEVVRFGRAFREGLASGGGSGWRVPLLSAPVWRGEMACEPEPRPQFASEMHLAQTDAFRPFDTERAISVRVEGERYEQLTRFCARHEIDLQDVLCSVVGLVAGSFLRAEAALHTVVVDERTDGIEAAARSCPEEFVHGEAKIIDAMRKVRRHYIADLADIASRETGQELAISIHCHESSEGDDVKVESPKELPVARVDIALAPKVIRLSQPRGSLRIGSRFLDRVAAVVGQLESAQTLGDLCLLLPEELVEWRDFNARAPRLESSEYVHERVLRQAGITPERCAVRFADRALTYAELQRATLAIAASLTRRFPDGGAAIGVATARCIELPAVILAILASGNVYVPLDPSAPGERSNEIARSVSMAMIVTGDADEPFWPDANLPCQRISTLRDVGAALEVLPTVGSAATAYIMFTSGSSGTPKAVPISHGALANLLSSMAQTPGVTEADNLLAVTTTTFDISLLELLLPLVVGGCVVVAGEGDVRDGEQLQAALRRNDITIMQATPTLWELLIRSGWQGDPRLRALCGGERMPAWLKDSLSGRVAQLWNMYGPTETTIWSTCARVEGAEELPPIGWPVANTSLVIADRCGRALPSGVAGELCIGGAGVSPGYLNDGGLTASRFVRINLCGIEERVYRTGDLARLAPHGGLHFLGRLDRQVKIRGRRIEPEEIERALLAISSIRESAVVVHNRGTVDATLIAFVSSTETMEEASVLQRLRARLPQYMLPRRIVFLPTFPRLRNGKLNRSELERMRLEPAVTAAQPRTTLERTLFEIWAELLKHRDFGVHSSFFEIGGHSILLLQCHALISAKIGAGVEVIDLFTHPTIERLATVIEERGRAPTPTLTPTPAPTSRTPLPLPPEHGEADIAVIGMAGRFPGAGDLAQFWTNIRTSVDSIVRFSEDELIADGADARLVRSRGYVRAAAMLDEADGFDAELFRVPAREAELMDPQHRVLLECAHAALDDAGYGNAGSRRIGLFAGVGLSTYLVSNLLRTPRLLTSTSPFEILYGNEKDYAVTQTAFRLDLSGPCVSIGTACSTGLVAVHYACRSLREHECEIALAGSAKVSVPQRRGYLFTPGGILARDGRCRPFDEAASGTVFGSGVGMVVLKRLADALRDRDSIYAVIKGSAVNNDGACKVGFTAPSRHGQSRVLEDAYSASGLSPASVGLIEGHGTGTVLGDPIEFSALCDVFAGNGASPGSCALGSVKGNIGHLDTAAGIAGFIKAVLALHHRVIPPHASYSRANSRMPLGESPFYIPKTAREWSVPTDSPARRAGVSAFGIGGTNAHIVLEEAPHHAAQTAAPDPADGPRPNLLVLSAHCDDALLSARQRLAAAIEPHCAALRDIAFTLQVGRREHRHRYALVARSTEEAIAALRATAGDRQTVMADRSRRLVFLFPGQGGLYRGIARDLYAFESAFRAPLDECVEAIRAAGGQDLRELIVGTRSAAGAAPFEETDIAQPALFALEYSIAKLLGSWGLVPDAVIGHSLGEYAAASVAGIFSLEDAARLVVERGRLMRQCSAGRMAAVGASVEAVARHLLPGCEIAAQNAEASTVVSGAPAPIEELIAVLRSRGFAVQPLGSNRAFHSAAMDPVQSSFAALVGKVARLPPKIRMISTAIGEQMSAADAQDVSYWTSQLRRPVLFKQALSRTLEKAEPASFVEIGPGAVLTTLAKARCGSLHSSQATLGRESGSEYTRLVSTLGALWCAGHTVDWGGVNAGRDVRRVHLPGYAYQRRRYAIAPREDAIPEVGESSAGISEAVDWTYQPSWKQRPHYTPMQSPIGDCAWVLVDYGTRRAAILEELEQLLLSAGATVERIFRPEAAAELLGRLNASRDVRVVYWCGDGNDDPHDLTEASADKAVERQLVQLHALALGIARRVKTARVRLAVVSHGVQRVCPDETGNPLGALCLGVVRTIPLEWPTFSCASIDFAETSGQGTRESARALLADCLEGLPDTVVAFRNGARWVGCFEPRRLGGSRTLLRPGATYLLTGGLGGIGREVALYLLRTHSSSLIIVGRTDPTGETRASRIVRERLESLRPVGGRVEYVAVDVSDERALHEALRAAEERVGSIEGVFHLAGVADGSLLELRRPDELRQRVSAKVRGSLALTRFLKERERAFLVLFSSITSVVGGIGQLAYTAANAFLNALAASQRAPHTIAVVWDTWKDVGMAVESALAPSLELMREKVLATALTVPEGLEQLENALAAELPVIVVSKTPLAERMARQASFLGPGAISEEPQLGLHARPELGNPYAEPREGTERTLAALWSSSLGVERVGALDDFFELGGSSLQAVRLAREIETALGVTVTPDVLLESRTIRDLVARFAQGSVSDKRGSIVRLSEGREDALPLVLIHPVAGQVFVYRELAHALRGGHPIYGLGAGEPLAPAQTVEELAACYLERILEISSRGPVLLGGSSFGGMVAFEIAQQLGRRGVDVPVVLMIDTPGGEQIMTQLGSDADIWSYLRSQLPEGAAATDDWARGLIKVFRANDRAMRAYRPAPYAGSVAFFKAQERRAEDPISPDLSWQAFCSRFELHAVPGNHLTVHEPPHVASLARAIASVLETTARTAHQGA